MDIKLGSGLSESERLASSHHRHHTGLPTTSTIDTSIRPYQHACSSTSTREQKSIVTSAHTRRSSRNAKLNKRQVEPTTTLKMPKIKAPKPRMGVMSAPTAHKSSKTKAKTKSRSREVGGLPPLDEILDLPDELELARGPLLRVRFPEMNGDGDSDDEDAPEIPQTRDELRRFYKPFPKLEVHNGQGEVLFDGPIQVLDYIHIRAGEVGGQSVEETEQWYGQITYIGARDLPRKSDQKKKGDKEVPDQPDVCLRVAWFYDHGMLNQRTLTPEDRRSCSNMIPGELIFSDHYDTVHLSSVLGRVDIKFFDEISTTQVPIVPGELFYRRAIFRDRVVSQHTPKNQCTSRCKLPYKPDRDIQHFCQRISCRRWFHTSCLEPNPQVKNRNEDYMIDYELPPEEQQLVDIVSSRRSKPNKKAFEHSSETEGEAEETSSMQRRLALVRQLPPQVRTLATSAITRGIESGQGVVGGAYAILQARWLARKVIIEGGILTREEEDDLAEEARLTNPDDGPRVTPRKYLCPSCADPI
ncbi:unnamed protein product [Rhizoctonia solani]|uniref:BAH domain-containing protein n=1 Tax=Rhizoctonia solani TaxID=456999 RepID=A0A8H3DTK2_9AGAM|nr:unnamed protein product [Rhizoctonia solani]